MSTRKSLFATTRRAVRAMLAALLLTSLTPASAVDVDLSDVPVFSTAAVPGNLILALSVEFPTASTPAYFSSIAYTTSTSASSAGAVVSPYVGYFDPKKCYEYIYVSATPESSYFTPRSATTSSFGCPQTAALPLWSGNYLNWATMQTLDVYRWALTGGARGTYANDDTATQTILQKVRHSGQGAGYSPDKNITSGINSATPFPDSWGTLRVQVTGGLGWSVYFFRPGAGTNVNYDGHTGSLSSPNPKAASNASKYRVWIRVKVCDSTVGLEANCVSYGGNNYKPEGLMQQYSSKLRYSAFGYLNDDSSTRDGAVMRARMKYVGPNKPVPGSAAVANTAAEWSSTTGVYVKNPDPTDATTTTSATTAAGTTVNVQDSGVLNYLNKFGTIYTGDYKNYDPVGELYYAASRYFRNKGNVPEYSSLTGGGTSMARWVDGFPVITNWDDPILYSCQKNFIIGIGDIYTWLDGNQPTSTLLNGQPTMPTTVSSDTQIDITKATNMVGALENKGNLGAAYKGGRNDTWLMAGLAYHMHTNDIRPDLSGDQTVASYWLDVKENQTYESKNVYYLLAKYGGFEVPKNYVAYPTSPTVWGSDKDVWWTLHKIDPVDSTKSVIDLVGSDPRPTNYFVADQGKAMVASLTSAFEKIAKEANTTVSTAFTAASPRQTSGSLSYSTNYTPDGWTGQLLASTVTYDSKGQPSYSLRWDARDALDTRSPTTRIIVTCCDNAGKGIPFDAPNLAASSFGRTNYASFSSVSGVVAGSYTQAEYLSYLRGDRTKERSGSSSSSSGAGVFRHRPHLLGDISGSQSTAVAGPNYLFFESTNPGYTGFKRKYKDRTTVVYAGANDGMLHAFDGSVSSASSSAASSASSAAACSSGGKCGYELFAYIPSFAYNGSGVSASSAPSTGLASLGSATSYSHHFLVDATPQYFDIDIKRSGTSAWASAASTENDWRSILIGGLGKGGKGYYALDITDPTSWTSEAAVKTKVLWEFPAITDTVTIGRMGYSYGAASVVKTKRFGWTAIMTSGYNNSDGKGYIFFVNPWTGALLDTVTVSDVSTEPLNLSGQTAFIPDYSDGTADAVYVGDLKGNVWRVDISDPSSFSAVKFAELSNSGTTGSTASSSAASTSSSSAAVAVSGSGARQAVTTRPMVEIDPSTLKRYVIIGTGRLLADSDIASNQVQSLYAIIDGKQTFGGFNKTLSSAFAPSSLTQNTDLLAGIGSAPVSDKGWYIDLTTTYIGASSSSAASSAASSGASSSTASSSSSSGSTLVYAPRVITDMTANTGIIAIPVDRPSGEVCDMNGDHNVIALALGSGKSVLKDAAGNTIRSSGWMKGLSTNLAFVNVGGKIRLLVGDTTATVTSVKGEFGSGAGLRRLNWREVPAVD